MVDYHIGLLNIIVFFPLKTKTACETKFGSFWEFLHGQKSGFTSTFFRVFHFHAHLFFTGTFFNFFHGLEIFCFRGKNLNLTIKRSFGGTKLY